MYGGQLTLLFCQSIVSIIKGLAFFETSNKESIIVFPVINVLPGTLFNLRLFAEYSVGAKFKIHWK